MKRPRRISRIRSLLFLALLVGMPVTPLVAQDPPGDLKLKQNEMANALQDLGGPDEEKQYMALEKLGELKFTESIAPIVDFAERTTYSHLAHCAGEALHAIDKDAAAAAVKKAVTRGGGGEVTARHRLILLWEIGTDAAIETMLSHYSIDPRPKVRMDLIRAVGELRVRRASELLTRALSAREGEVRNQAAIAIGKLNDPTLAPALMGSLDNTDDNLNWFAAWALGRIEDPGIFPQLAGRLGGGKGAEARAKALEATARDPSHVDKLIGILKNARLADYRIAAARALGRLGKGNREAMQVLLNAMLGRGDRIECYIAFSSLSRIADEEFGAVVMKRTGQNDHEKLRLVYEILGDLGIKEAAPMMMKRIFSENRDDKTWKVAAINLWKINDRETTRRFEEFLGRTANTNAIQRGVQALGFRRNARGFRFLANLLRKYRDGSAEQLAVEMALERLTGHFFGPQYGIWRKWFNKHPDFFTPKQQELDRKKWRDEFDKENQGFRQTSVTEASVQLGLRWLARHQDGDGAWDPQRYMEHDPPNARGSRDGARIQLDPLGATALTALAFLGAGYGPDEGKYKDEISRGLEYVMARQHVDGKYLGNALAGGYNRPIALMALAEAFNITRDPRYVPHVQVGADFLAAIQNNLGGWRYRVVIETTDTSCCSWNAFALKAAEKSGFRVREIVFEGIRDVFDLYSSPVTTQREEFIEDHDPTYGFDVGTGTKYKYWTGYQNNAFPDGKYATVALGLMTRIFLGYRRTHPFCIGSANAVLEDFFEEIPPREDWSKYRSRRDYPAYAWYYGTLAMHQMGGRYFREWNAAIKKIVPGTQVKEGPDAGTWPVWNLDTVGGRLYTTAMGVLTLETYYRYLPILED